MAGLNPNWTFAWFDLDRKEWFPSAVDQATGLGYFTLDTRRGAHRFFAGNPVLADNPEVKIAVLSDGKSRIVAAANNVGDTLVKTQLRLNPALGACEPVALELAPGELKEVNFAWTPHRYFNQ